MLIRKDWKSSWTVQSESTGAVSELCSGCVLPEPSLMDWAAAASLASLCPAPTELPSSAQLSSAQQCPAKLSSAQLGPALLSCPPQAAASDSSFPVPLQTEFAASAAPMPHPVPAHLSLLCTCLFRCARASLSAHSQSCWAALQLCNLDQPLLGIAVLPPETQHGLGLPHPGSLLPGLAACTNCWTAQMYWGGQGSLWAVTERLLSQSQPHPAAGHGSTHHRMFLLIHQLSPACWHGCGLACCSQRAFQGKWFQSCGGNLCIPVIQRVGWGFPVPTHKTLAFSSAFQPHCSAQEHSPVCEVQGKNQQQQ